MAITINNVRFSYTNLFAPKSNFEGQEPVYSVTILLPKSETAEKAAIDKAIEDATLYGVGEKWNGVRPPVIPNPVHDGDGVKSDGTEYGPECKGCWVFTAKSKDAPFVVDHQVNNIIDPTKVYSGMWGNVSVSFYPYSFAGKKGIGCGLAGVQKVRDDEPLGGRRITASEAFRPVAVAIDPVTGLPEGSGALPL